MFKRKIWSSFFVVFIIISCVLGNSFISSKVEAEEMDVPQLIPTPQKVEYGNENVTITNSVNLKGKGVADTDAIREMEEFLVENNITINQNDNPEATTIWLAEAGDTLDGFANAKKALGGVDASKLKAEGYVLSVSKSASSGGTILIEGKDERGTFYGVQTLKQLAQGNKVKEAVITDQPNMTDRGSIEGFYAHEDKGGVAWTYEDREDQIKFYGETKLNTYIYAPKDDPYHRQKWREPYPEAEMKKMESLIASAHANKVHFVFALSPGNDIKLTGTNAEADYQTLVNKCQLMYDKGVRSFAIFFDDISISGNAGELHAKFLNRFNEEFVKAKGDVTPLVTVPTQYDTNAMRDGTQFKQYTKDFSVNINEGIEILWTGPATVPDGITAEDTKLIKTLYGNQLGIWWNYPCNDYMLDKVGIGPIYGLDNELGDMLHYFVMNPMGQAALSKITLATGADYSWNTSVYDDQVSFKKALSFLYGDLASDMYTFANHSSRLAGASFSSGRPDAPEVRELMDTVIDKISAVEDLERDTDIVVLRNEFTKMISASETLKTGLTGKQLEHSSKSLDQLKALGESDILALDLLIAKVNQDGDKVTSLTAILNENLTKLTSKNVKKVSEGTALSFIREAVDYDIHPIANFEVSKTIAKPNEELTFVNKSSFSVSEYEWTFEGANILKSSDKNPTISYKREGTYKVKLVGRNRFGEAVEEKSKYIVITNQVDGSASNIALNKTASASNQAAASESAAHAIDGQLSTKWCSTRNPQWLLVDLGKESTITGFTISHAQLGGEGSGLNTRNYYIETSNDNKEFSKVVDVEGNTEGYTVHTIPVTNARYVRLTITKPTQDADSAARIYEFEVLGYEEKINLPEEFIPADKQELQKAIEEANAISDETLNTIVPSVIKEFKAVVSEANAILVDNSAPQTEVNTGADKLQKVLKKLLSFVKGDKTDLNTLMAEIKTLQEINYEKNSWKILQEALKEAKLVFEDEEALKEDVREAYNNLKNAKEALGIVTNKDELYNILVAYNGYKSTDYTSDSWSVFKAAYDSATALYKDPLALQTEVNKAIDELEAAASKLQKENSDGAIIPNKDLETTTNPKPNPNVNTNDNTNIQKYIFIGAIAGISLLIMKRKSIIIK